MTRTATWEFVGKNVKSCGTVEEVIKTSGLDYEVEKQPIFLDGGFQIPNKVATVKKETGEYIGVVSPSYTIYQNKDALSFVDNIPNLEFVKAGETKGGMVYIIGKLPSTTVLNDEFTPFVIFQTSHNGMYNLRMTICPLRIVCQNQFAWSFKQMSNTISIRHSSQIESRVRQAQILMNDTAQYMHGFTNTAEELALLKLGSADTIYKIIDAFFDSTKEITERQRKAIEDKKSAIIRCYGADDNANFRGTAWGAVNAFTDFNTHAERKQTANATESKFMNVTFDTAALTKFIECVRAYA